MATWENNGSYRDISDLAADSLAVTSQHGGNQIWANTAHTAPGGESGALGSDVGEPVVQDAPVIDEIVSVKPGEDGKPQARTDTTPAPSPNWTQTTVPTVVREK